MGILEPKEWKAKWIGSPWESEEHFKRPDFPGQKFDEFGPAAPMLRKSFNIEKANIKNIVVPSDSYYLLADNRDNAADSRYEGFISEERIKGRIIYSYWGNTMARMNIDFRDK